eukprot:CAMPEP_0201592654 /NCGR_PEP_ID=MMETSP0190_2-20130828/190488_1 /ASSEMBLY_ACC=CAM_ASM_000263 /TAXON_ID=37353 /ORGANISM="Rosalina sp." /LENGTH=669 /DNA_ID=CAMNT_0048051523 /DNA_START=23 /DNA_END=2032 /DNA_ORIENTATION=-
MSVALESPALNRSITKQKRKRRPTRTPKPSTPQSAAKRLCSPSPFLDRSFQRKKLYFGGSSSTKNDKEQRESEDSEYNPDESLFFDEEEEEYEESTEYHDYGYSNNNNEEEKQDKFSNLPKFNLTPRGNTTDLLTDIQNLSICNKNKTKSLLRNARSSIKTSKSPSISTPTLFDQEKPTKITSKIKKKPSVKKQQETIEKTEKVKKVTQVRITKSHRVFKKCHKFDRLLVKPLECGSGDKFSNLPKFNLTPRGNSTDLLTDIQNLSICNKNKTKSLLRNARSSIKTSKSPSISTPTLFDQEKPTKITSKIKKKPSVKKQQETEIKKPKKVTQIRITKSHRVFKKCHKFDRLLVKPLECGSGCPLYCSYWKDEPTVTKLMPLFENEEFTKEENVDNALREFEFHADIYRKSVKLYGMDETPTCPIYACVNLKHDGECNKDDPNDKPKPYLAFVMPQFHCNLSQFVNKYRKLSKSEAKKLLITGLRFLKLLGENEMVHCDIKPENIFLDVRISKYDDGVKISHFVFADFGCAALKTEEFPYGNLTGTITMWDLAALGKKYGDENGFDARNDLYGMIGSLLDGVYGGSIMEELLEEADENWEETEWGDYSGLIRKCRNEIMSDKFMEKELNELGLINNDDILRTVLLQIGKKRKDRMTMKQILSQIDIEYKL